MMFPFQIGGFNSNELHSGIRTFFDRTFFRSNAAYWSSMERLAFCSPFNETIQFGELKNILADCYSECALESKVGSCAPDSHIGFGIQRVW